jgi:hypothetical protein
MYFIDSPDSIVYTQFHILDFYLEGLNHEKAGPS